MSKFKAIQIKNWDSETRMNTANKFYPARPENYKFDSIILRIKLAYGVLIGKYDALDWGCLQSEKDGDKV